MLGPVCTAVNLFSLPRSTRGCGASGSSLSRTARRWPARWCLPSLGFPSAVTLRERPRRRFTLGKSGERRGGPRRRSGPDSPPRAKPFPAQSWGARCPFTGRAPHSAAGAGGWGTLRTALPGTELGARGLPTGRSGAHAALSRAEPGRARHNPGGRGSAGEVAHRRSRRRGGARTPPSRARLLLLRPRPPEPGSSQTPASPRGDRRRNIARHLSPFQVSLASGEALPSKGLSFGPSYRGRGGTELPLAQISSSQDGDEGDVKFRFVSRDCT